MERGKRRGDFRTQNVRVVQVELLKRLERVEREGGDSMETVTIKVDLKREIKLPKDTWEELFDEQLPKDVRDVDLMEEYSVSSTTTLKRSGVKDEWGDRYKMRGFFEGTVEMSPVISSLPGKPLNSVSNMRKRELLVTTTGSLMMI